MPAEVIEKMNVIRKFAKKTHGRNIKEVEPSNTYRQMVSFDPGFNVKDEAILGKNHIKKYKDKIKASIHEMLEWEKKFAEYLKSQYS